MKKRRRKKAVEYTRTKWAFQTSYMKKIPRYAAIFCGVLLFCLLAYSVVACLPVFQGRFHRSGVPAAEIVNTSDTFNMLIITYDEDARPVQLMLYRLDSTKKRMAVMPIPLELKTERNGVTETVLERLEHSGTGTAISVLESAAQIQIRYYCVLTADSLAKVMELFGSFNYTVPKDITCTLPGSGRTIRISSGLNVIDSTKATVLMSDGGYDSTSERYAAQAGLMKAFVSQKLCGYYIDHADSLFKSVLNTVRTNFSYNDLLSRLNSVKAISERSSFVISLVPSMQDAAEGEAAMVNFDSKTIGLIKSSFSSDQ